MLYDSPIVSYPIPVKTRRALPFFILHVVTDSVLGAISFHGSEGSAGATSIRRRSQLNVCVLCLQLIVSGELAGVSAGEASKNAVDSVEERMFLAATTITEQIIMLRLALKMGLRYRLT